MSASDREFFCTKFKKSEIKKISSSHLGFIIAASHALNELVAIRNMMTFEARANIESEFTWSHISLRWMTLARISLGKIHEFETRLGSHIGELRKNKDKLSEQVIDLKRKTKVGEDTPSWLPMIRNKISFHYNIEYILECFKNINDEQILNLFTSSIGGARNFFFAEEIISLSTFSAIGDSFDKSEQRHQIAFHEVMSHMRDSTNRIVEFASSYTIMCFKEFDVKFETTPGIIPEQLLCTPLKDVNPLFAAPGPAQEPPPGTVSHLASFRPVPQTAS